MIRKFLFSFIIISTLLLAACSADEPFSLPGADGNTTLEILIPTTQMVRDTRAEDGSSHGIYMDRLADEGKINSLVVIGFYGNGTDRNHFFTDLTNVASKVVENVYQSYTLSVVPGNYDLYVVANIPTATLEGISDTNTLEEKVKSLIYSYVTDSSDPALPKVGGTNASGLPMAKKESVTVSEGSAVSKQVNLEFVCSKVRLTVIYNDTDDLEITSLDLKNPYSPTKVFLQSGESHGTGNKISDMTGVGHGAYFDLSGSAKPVGSDIEKALKEWTLAEWTQIHNDADDDPLNNFSTTTDSRKCYAWQETLYLPEAVNVSAPTFMKLYAGSLSADINIGCSNTDTDDHTAGGNIKRGNFYDIVAKVDGGKVTYSWNVKGWSPENLSISLAGLTSLWLESDYIAGPVKGDDACKISYATSSPRLSFVSCVSNDANQKPIFDIVENKEESVLEVSLNSSVTTSTPLPGELGFWVEAGNVRKWVRINEINAEAFFRISPDDRYLYISQIVNETSYPLIYEYATNMDSFTLNLTDYSNSNVSKSKENLSLAVYTGTYNGTMDGLELFTDEVDMTESSSPTSRNIKSIKTGDWPKSGVIVITIKDPSNQQAFGKKISGSIKGEGISGSTRKQDRGNFEINPAPHKYTIHFRAKNDDWDAPHVYVYQPLTYTYKGNNDKFKGKEFECYDNNITLNWLEYSFTGKYVFRGWDDENGSVAHPETDPIELTHAITKNKFDGYKIWANDAGELDNFTTEGDNPRYFGNIDLISEHRAQITNCSHCKSTTRGKCEDNKFNSLWPGVCMIKESTPDENGYYWWKIELPMLAEPGNAMVMFANGHKGDGTKRWPSDKMPGMPLPNFASCEAWFLYDGSKTDVLDFSDYPRETYPGNGGSSNTRKVAIWWYQGKFASEKLCLFSGSNDSNASYWPGPGYPYKEGDHYYADNNYYSYVIFESASDLDAFDKMTTDNSAGYAFYLNSLVWWNYGKHRTAPLYWLTQKGVTEAYEIWQ